jgi:type IV pilus assembly protein PilE
MTCLNSVALRRTQPSHPRQAGFNLLELMIVVAIIGILSSLAYTSYQDSVVKSRRKAATACMLEEGQFLERWYTTNLTYVGATAALGANRLQCQTDLLVFYAIAPSAEAVRTYTITATPDLTKQKDLKCSTMTVDQAGAKTKSGTSTIAECFP